jgi:hypothetical protein
MATKMKIMGIGMSSSSVNAAATGKIMDGGAEMVTTGDPFLPLVTLHIDRSTPASAAATRLATPPGHHPCCLQDVVQ